MSSVTTIASQPHASARATRLSTSVVGRAPVELEPARRVAQDPRRTLLHRLRGLVGEHHRRARCRARRAPPRSRPRVRELEHADRREQERARQAAPEQLDAGVALRDVAQHPRHDPPAVEGRAVSGQRPFVPGAGGDIGERLASHAPQRGRFEPVRVDGNVWPPAADAVEIDPCLAPHADHAAASQHTSPLDRAVSSWVAATPFRNEHVCQLAERRDVNRVSPFRKGLVRFTTAPAVSPQPKPPMR